MVGLTTRLTGYLRGPAGLAVPLLSGVHPLRQHLDMPVPDRLSGLLGNPGHQGSPIRPRGRLVGIHPPQVAVVEQQPHRVSHGLDGNASRSVQVGSNGFPTRLTPLQHRPNVEVVVEQRDLDDPLCASGHVRGSG